MELPFELSFGQIVGQTYWWWCEFIDNHLGVYVAFVGEPDALVGEPDALVGEPDALVGEPDALVGPIVLFFTA